MTTFAYTGGALSNLTGNTPGANVSNLVTLLNDLKTFLNGANLDATNIAEIPESLLALAVQQKLGLNDGGQIGRGKSIIAAQGTRTNAAYGALNNGPDQVAGIVLPTDGLLMIGFRAYWNCSVPSVGNAAIFIGANQLKVATVNQAAGVAQYATTPAGPVNNWLFSYGPGLISTDGTGAGVEGTDAVTTGLVVGGVPAATSGFGGFAAVEAAAGTYTVSVQFKSSSGTVTAQNRKLWVWTMGF